MWTTRRRQREREAKSGIRLEEIREEKATEVEDRCCPSDEEARSRTSGFQSETSDHEDKAIHPRRNRGTGAFHRLTRRRPHACSIHTCTSAQVWCGCVRTHACACGWLHCLNLEACGRVYASGSRDLARKEREGWAAGTLEGSLFYVGWTWTCPTGQRSPRSRNQFNDRP